MKGLIGCCLLTLAYGGSIDNMDNLKEKIGDREKYLPPDEAGCPDEVNNCIADFHTGAGDCLMLMAKEQKEKKSFACLQSNPALKVQKQAMFEASNAWHEAMKQCLAGEPSPDPSATCLSEDVGNNSTNSTKMGSPELQACWAEKAERKAECLALTQEQCPRLAACMGLGDAASTDDSTKDWHCYVKALRLDTNEAFSAYGEIAKLCEGEEPPEDDQE
jgi:hypothetical protein